MSCDPAAPAPADPRVTVAEAVALHGAGRLADAATVYRSLVTAHPDFLPAVHGLGLVTNDLGWPDRALPLLARCVAAEPENVTYRCSLGLVLLRIGRAEAAAVALLPAANAAPPRPDARLLLARALGDLDRWTEADAIMREATALFPDRVDLWRWRGHTARALGHLDEAEAAWNRTIALDADDVETLNNLGVLLRGRGRLAEAAHAYRQALRFRPADARVHGNLGNLLGQMCDEAGAELHLRRALALEPDFQDGQYNLGAHLLRCDHPAEALPYLERVAAAAPDRWDALTNLGVAHVALGQLEAAEACYRRALTLNPGNPEAHYDLAWLLLLTGRWHEGWQEYEWRWEMPSFSSRRRTFAVPAWDGTRLDGALLLHPEQGLGDAIQFVRYATLAAARCREVVIAAPAPLMALFTDACAAGLLPGRVIADDAAPAGIAAHAPFMSLPRIFETTPDTVPATIPYMCATRPAPPLPPGRRIGLVWAGSPDNRIDRQRSLPAAMLAPLFAATDAAFVSLQIGPRAAEAADLPGFALRLDAVARDFADTAAVIAALDLVIGVDTAVLHLAGAMGKPAWMLLPFAPDYRWMLGRDDTPWYPSLRLFRQPTRGDWAATIAAVAEALALWTTGTNRPS